MPRDQNFPISIEDQLLGGLSDGKARTTGNMCSPGTAVEFRSDLASPLVFGDSAAVVLDGRSGSFGTGSNGALAAHWVILDTFVGGESIAP